MNIINLRENKLISNIVKSILDNDEFYNNCEQSIKKILADNKINEKDIPVILNLLITVYNQYNTIKFDKKDLREILILLFIELLEKFNFIENLNIDSIIELLEPQIDLLLVSVNINQSFTDKLFCFSCCSNKPKDINNP